MTEQENIWEYYKAILTRLRTRMENPYSPTPDGFAPDDNSQLYCVREALVNFLAHADYFSEIHSTVRVYDNEISLQNPGSFPVNINLVGKTIVSQPRNPNILRFFKLAKLSENGGYGIDKILNWRHLTGCNVTISSDITKSEVVFKLPIGSQLTSEPQSPKAYPSQLTSESNQLTSEPKAIHFKSRRLASKTDPINAKTDQLTSKTDPINAKTDQLTPKTNQLTPTSKLEQRLIKLIEQDKKISIAEMSTRTQQSRRTIDRVIRALKDKGMIIRTGKTRSGEWKFINNREE